jgi:hypothetical protein
MLAAVAGHEDIVQMLINARANLELEDKVRFRCNM